MKTVNIVVTVNIEASIIKVNPMNKSLFENEQEPHLNTSLTISAALRRTAPLRGWC